MEENPGERLTATDLCDKMRLFKSQMNKVLNSMEEKGYIKRIRSNQDKRFVYIELSQKGLEEYNKEHEDIMLMIDSLVDKIGSERTEKTADAVKDISEELSGLM